MSVLLYGAEIWTLLAADMKTLEAFYMSCQQQILDIRWWAHVSNTEVLQRSCLSAIGDILCHRRLSLAMLHTWILECQHMMLCI